MFGVCTFIADGVCTDSRFATGLRYCEQQESGWVVWSSAIPNERDTERRDCAPLWDTGRSDVHSPHTECVE